jgi:ribosome maturation factor RimP
MPTLPPSLHGSNRAALDRVVEPIARAHGAEVVDMELRTERGSWVLRVYVEKAGAAAQNLSTRDAAVNLELCANVSRDLSPALDVADLIPHITSRSAPPASNDRFVARATSGASPARKRS